MTIHKIFTPYSATKSIDRYLYLQYLIIIIMYVTYLLAKAAPEIGCLVRNTVKDNTKKEKEKYPRRRCEIAGNFVIRIE